MIVGIAFDKFMHSCVSVYRFPYVFFFFENTSDRLDGRRLNGQKND